MSCKQSLSNRGQKQDIPTASTTTLTTIQTMLPLSSLEVDVPYLQNIMESHAKMLAEHWDERLFDPLTVSLRDGKYYVIDGRHRMAALKLLNIEDAFVQCTLYQGLTVQEEAELTYRIHRARPLRMKNLKKLSKEIEQNELSQETSSA